MTELDKALGKTDQDVVNFKVGVEGLADGGFTDTQIAAFAVEEAQSYRSKMNALLRERGLKPAFPTDNTE